MKRYGMFRFLALSLLLGWSQMSLCATVSSETAAKVGWAFAQQNALIKDSVTGVGTPYAFGKRWVVPLEPSGYVLLESDDTLKPVVAFATTDFPDLTGAPEGLVAFFSGEDYEEEEFTVPVADDEAEATSSEVTAEEATIAVAAVSGSNISLASATELSMGDEENTVVSTSSTETTSTESSDTETSTSESSSTEPHEDWSLLLDSLEEADSEVDPMDSGIMLMSDSLTIGSTTLEMANVKYLDVATKWNQCLPYNLYAPGLTEKNGTGYGGSYGWRGAAGCVAIAEAQIAAYLRWPYRLHGTYHLNFGGNTGHLQFHQAVAPGNPYDWNAINDYSHSGCNEDPYGNEVARVINHWATCTQMYYQRSGGGGTAYWCADARLPILGYTNVSSSASTAFGALRESIYTYGLPAAVTIPGHAIVGAGWAEAVDNVLSSDSCYAYLNYGWGGGTTWYTAYDSGSNKIGSALIRAPLPYGEVTKVADTAITWYESPWFTERAGTLTPETTRILRRIAIADTTATQTVDLEALAATDSNWTYDSSTGLTRAISAGLSSTITAGTYYAGGSSVTFGLTRRTDETNTAETWEESGSTLTLQVVSLWDGTTLQENQVKMSSTDLTEESVSVTLSDLDLETPWKLVLVTSASSTDAVASIPYYITSITVEGAALTTDESVTFDVSTDSTCSESTTINGLYTKTFDTLSTLADGDRAFYAMLIGEDTTDYVWSQCLTEAAPTVTWTTGQKTSETDGWRFWLPTPDTAVTFDIADADSTEISSVTAYLSNALWVDQDTLTSSDGMGIVLSSDEITSTGTGTWSCSFKFSPNTSSSVEDDTLSLDSSTAVGRDAVLSIKVVDAEGNVGWSHARMTFGVTSGSLATTSGEVSTTNATARTTDILLSEIRRTYSDLDFSVIVEAYNNALTTGQTEAEFRAAVFQKAVEAGVLPSPINAYTFDGSCSMTNGGNLSYTDSPFGQAFQIVANSEPYGGHSMGAGNTTWTASAVIYPTAQAPTDSDTKPGILWMYGSVNGSDFLTVTWTRADSEGNGTLGIYRDNVSTCLATAEISATTWHLINIVYDGSTTDSTGATSPTLTIYVDGEAVTTKQATDLDGALPSSSTGFQIGSGYGGLPTGFVKGYGIWVDDYRGWSVALADTQLAKFWETWKIDHVVGTSTSTETTLKLSNLTWTKDNTAVDTSSFTTNTVAQVTIPSTVTKFTVDNVPMNTLSLTGSGNLELVADEPSSGLKFIDLTLLGGSVTFGSGTHDLATILYPGNTYTDGAGETGDPVGLSLTGGTISLTGGTFYWPETTSAENTTISVTNDVKVIAEDSLGVGEATYNFSGTSSFEAARLILSQGAAGRTSYMTLSESASGVVTGSNNVDTNQSSIMIGHWAGPSTLTIKDSASLTAEAAEMLVGKTGYAQTINLEGGTLTALGIKLSANASGTNTLKLAGGDLRLGSTGIDTYSTSRSIAVNVTGDSKITATDSDLPITQAVTVNTDATWTIDGSSAGNTVTLTGTLTNNGTIAMTANGTLDIGSATLSGSGAFDLSAGTLAIGERRTIAASDTVIGATIDLTPTDEEVTNKSISVTINGVTTAQSLTTTQVTLTASDGNRLPVTAVTFSDNTLTVSIGTTQTIDLSSVTSFPITLTDVYGVTLTNGGTPARTTTIFSSNTKLLALPEVENATWTVTETENEDGTITYTYILTPNATDLPDALTTWTFDGVDPEAETATMTFGRSLPNLGQAGVLEANNVITGTSSDLTGSWTVTLMVLPTTAPAGDKTVILSFGATPQMDDVVLTWDRTSSTQTTSGTFAVTNGLSCILKTDTTFDATQWHAVTLTYDSAVNRLYLTVDHVDIGYVAIASLPLPSAFSFGSGYTDLPYDCSSGAGHRVDQVIRWDSALTTAQLDAAYADYEDTYILYVDDGTVTTSSVTKLFEPSTTVDASTLDASAGTLWLLAFDAASGTLNVDGNVTIPVKTYIDSGSVTLGRSTTDNTGVISNLQVLSDDVTITFNESQTNYVTTRAPYVETDSEGTETSTYLGTFKFVGGTEESPLVVNYTGTTANTDYGKYAIGADSWLNIHNAGANKVYTVTGEDPATSILVLTSGSDWGCTAQSEDSFTNLTIYLPSTLVSDSTTANRDFWIRPGSTSNVIINTDRKLTLEESYSDNSTASTSVLDLVGLTGSGTLNATVAKTINLDLASDCTYSGSPNALISFEVSKATWTLSGASVTYGNSFTIEEGGAVKFASSGTQTVSGVISGTGNLEIASGTVTLSKANTLTGTTTVSDATLNLSGSVAGPIILAGGTLNATGSTANAISVSGTSVITGTVTGAITLAEGALLDLSNATFSLIPTLESSTATLILSSAQATSDTTYTIPSGMTVKVELASTVDLTQDFTATGLTLEDENANVIFILTSGQEVTGSKTTLISGTTYTWSTDDTTTTAYDWTDTTHWSDGVVPPGNSDIVIQVPSTGVTLNIPSAVGGLALTVEAADESSTTTGTLTLKGDGSLSVTSATINEDTEVSTTGTSSLGPATIASGKTLTVGPLTTISSVSGSGTLKVTEASTLSDRSILGTGTNLTFAGGVAHQITAASNGSGTGFVNGRTVTITGSGTTVTTSSSVGDITGYAADGTKSAIVITDGATFTLGRRDTLNTPVTLCNGIFALGTSAGNSNRALDIYNTNASLYDFTVNATEDATSENPTVSYLKALNTTAGSANRIVSIRRGDLRVNVAENAKFVIDADLSTSVSNADYTGSGGALVKYGAGILELKGDNSGQKTTTTVNEGTLLVSGTGTLGTGTVTTVAGATLEIATTSATTLATTFTNNGTLLVDAGSTARFAPTDTQTVSGTVTNNGTLEIASGTVTFSGTVTGGITLSGGTLNAANLSNAIIVSGDAAITGSLANNTITLAEGATLDLTGATLSTCNVALADGATSATVTFASDAVTESSAGITIGSAGITVKVEVASSVDLSTDYTAAGLTLATDQNVIFVLANGGEMEGSGNTLVAEATTYTATLEEGENTWSTVTWTPSITNLKPIDTVVLMVPSAGASLSVDSEIAVNTLTVQPADETATIGTLTLSVNSGASLSTSAMTANANVIANDDCVTWAALTIADGIAYTVNYTSDTARTLQTGFAANTGTFALTSGVTDGSTVEVTLPIGLDTAAQESTLPAITVGSGVQLSFEASQTFAGTYTISVLNGGILTVHENCTTLLAGTSTLSVAAGGVIEFTHSSDYKTLTNDFGDISGTGTIRFSGAGYRTLPSTVTNMPPTALTFENNVTSGLILTNGTGAYEIGSLTGSGSFRADYTTSTSRTLTIVQSSSTTFSGALLTTNEPGRLSSVTVKYADGVTSDATLTLSGNTPSGQARPLTVAGSVKITGSYDGDITVSSTGTLELDTTGDIGSVTNNGGTLILTSGSLDLDSTATGSITVGLGATLNIVLTNAEAAEGYTYTGITVTSSETETVGKVNFVDAAGNILAEDVTVTDTVATYTPSTVEWKASTQSWSNTSGPAISDSTCSVPIKITFDGDTEEANTFTFGTDGTLEATTVNSVTVEGTGTINVTSALSLTSITFGATAGSTDTVTLNNTTAVTIIGGFAGYSALTYTGSADVEVQNQALKNSTYNGKLTINGSGNFKVGNNDTSSYAFTVGDTLTLGSSVEILSGTLYLHPLANGTGRTTYTTDKVQVPAPITFAGGTLYTEDGAYYFSDTITVNTPASGSSSSTSFFVTQWAKGLYIANLEGEGPITFQNDLVDAAASPPIHIATAPYSGTVSFQTNRNSNSSQIRTLTLGDGALANADVVFDSASTATTTLSLTDNHTLKSLSGADATVSGDYTLTISEGTDDAFAGTISTTTNLTLNENAKLNLTGATLGSNSYSGTITLGSGSTLTLAPSAATSISSTLSGTGTLAIDGTNTVTLTGGANGSFAGIINVLDGATLVANPSGNVFPFGGSSATLNIASGGTVKPVGDCRFWGILSGEGDLTLETSDAALSLCGNPNSVARTDFTGTLTIGADCTLYLNAPAGGSPATLSEPDIVVNGTLTGAGVNASSSNTGSFSVASGKTLSGTGTINCAVTFDDGATLDVSQGVLTAQTTVTGSGVLSVTPPTTLTSGTAIFAAANQTETFLSTLVPTSDIATGYLKIDSTGIVLQEVTVSKATVRDTTDASATTTVTLDETSQAKILAAVGQQASDATAITSVTGETNTGAETATTLSEEELEGALALFENIVTVTTTTTEATETTEASTTATAKVAYDFGVTAITVKSIGDESCVVITAKVSNASTNTSTAAFASGTTVTVSATDSDGTTKSITATEVTSEEGTTAGATSEAGVKYFKVPLTELGGSGTVQFSVKASNTTTSTTAE